MTVKQQNEIRAKQWVENYMDNSYWRKQLDSAVENTTVYEAAAVKDFIEKVKPYKGNRKMRVTIVQSTSYDAIMDSLDVATNKIAVLNTADFFHPGGQYLTGGVSQEESLCAVSGLYTILKHCSAYSRRNTVRRMPPEYNTEVIYAKDVPFTLVQDLPSIPCVVADVISITPPNTKRISINRSGGYTAALMDRITAAYVIPAKKANVLILNAWGCGKYRNDETLIANMFKRVMQDYGNLYRHVIFAIPNEAQYNKFCEVFY